MTNIHAAIGYAQLNKLNKVLLQKKKIFLQYKKSLNSNKNLRLISNPKYSQSNHLLNLVQLIKQKSKKNKLIKKFSMKKIEVRPIWRCNHLQKPYLNYQKYKITKAPKMVSNCLCLPSSYFLKNDKIKKISNLLKKWE